MSVRVHMKELAYLSIATLIILIIVWNINNNNSELSMLNKSPRFNFQFDNEIYNIKKVVLEFNGIFLIMF